VLSGRKRAAVILLAQLVHDWVIFGGGDRHKNMWGRASVAWYRADELVHAWVI